MYVWLCACVCLDGGGGCLCERYVQLFPRDRAGGESLKLCVIVLSQSRFICRTVPLCVL